MSSRQEKPKRPTAKQIPALVWDWINRQGNATFNYKQVSHALGADTPALQRIVAGQLAIMASERELLEVTPGKYKKPNRTTSATGIFVRRSNGKNSVITDGDSEPVLVAERNSRHALNGDRVAVTIAAHRKGVEPEAIVTKIIEKKEQTFIGTLRIDKYFAVLNTDSKYLANDIIIPRNRLKGGKTGDKAIVEITSWPEDAKNPTGRIVDILGQTGDNQAEMHALLAEFGLPYRYPANVEKAAEKIGDGITKEEVARREDFRDRLTFTIDPADAKDFDDALSIKPIGKGRWEIGVHIADVTHYVHPDTILDREAASRATSVYLVDRVVPMLPEHLSNGICSLRPDEDKLTYSCIFEMDNEAKVLKSRICRTVIRSNRRFSYEEAQAIIEGGDGDCRDAILKLNELAQILRRRRFENGAMEFERAEVKFRLDDMGNPIGVYFKESKEANKLIEEFMLLANRTVAETIGCPKGKKTPKAFVYRVHDQPDPTKLADLAQLSRNFGYKVKTSGNAREINRSINKMLKSIKGKGEENYLSTLAIRSMAKAIYSTINIGHYGLAFDYYTHFTSPIRRYPDMMVHRLLAKYLDGGRSVNATKLEDECKHSSEMEQLAANAERASIKYKQVEFMQDHLGEEFEGTITGVTEWGLYVEVNENLCEGLVPVRDLTDDFYDYDEKHYTLTGRRHHQVYRLGDPIKVRVARANLEKKQLDFVPADKPMIPGEDNLGYIPGSAAADKHSRGSKRSNRKNSRRK